MDGHSGCGVVPRLRYGPARFARVTAADPPEWYDNIKSVEWKTQPPLAVGSKIAFTAQFMGRRLAYTYELTDYIPGERALLERDQTGGHD